jgi:hypothetical protein
LAFSIIFNPLLSSQPLLQRAVKSILGVDSQKSNVIGAMPDIDNGTVRQGDIYVAVNAYGCLVDGVHAQLDFTGGRQHQRVGRAEVGYN